jgi:asparagine synthase (glutamine-hydrolysing)
MMAKYISAGQEVVEVGCGEMKLKEFLPEPTRYTGIDYIKRAEGTVVCDFNKERLPRLESDIYFLAGVLEYAIAPDDIIAQICSNTRQRVILSYCLLNDFPEETRKQLNWVNSLNESDIRRLFKKFGFSVLHTFKVQDNTVFIAMRISFIDLLLYRFGIKRILPCCANNKKENAIKNAVEKQTTGLTDQEQDLARRIDNEGMSYIGFEGLCDLAQAAKTVENKNIKGVFIETGCALGGSAVLITAVKSAQRRLDVYDAFGMIPPPSDVDGKAVNERFAEIQSGKSEGLKGNKYYGYEDNLQQKVIDNFKKYKYPVNENHVRLIKGLYQDTLKVEEPVAFAHIDCDWYESVKLCLEKIIPNLQIGGVVVINDYYYYQGCKKAVDEFFASQKHIFKFTTRSRLQIERIHCEAK